MIEGVCITPLKQIKDDRGQVMHMLRADDPHFTQFGEVYFSCVLPRKVKAWKLHREMTLNCAVPHGKLKFVMYDTRKESKTHGMIQEIVMGECNYCLVKVPPNIWTGFQGLSEGGAVLANCATLPHLPDEYERRDAADAFFPYEWA